MKSILMVAVSTAKRQFRDGLGKLEAIGEPSGNR